MTDRQLIQQINIIQKRGGFKILPFTRCHKKIAENKQSRDTLKLILMLPIAFLGMITLIVLVAIR